MSDESVIIRVDASLEIGSGHVMRCLTLADGLKAKGLKCIFICREAPGHLADIIVDRGHEVFLLKSSGERGASTKNDEIFHSAWLKVSQEQDALDAQTFINTLPRKPVVVVVDHYAIDFRWEQVLRQTVDTIAVIDDLADRNHDCDVLVDQTFGRDRTDYTTRVPTGCVLLCGAQYAMLRPRFSELRAASLRRRRFSNTNKILVSMGGVDQDNVTLRVLRILNNCKLPSDTEIIVVMGKSAPWVEQVTKFSECMRYQTNVRVNVNDMAELMAASDIAIGAAGATSWERSCLGVPTVMLILAENQRYAASLLAAANAVELVAMGELFEASLLSAIAKILNDPGYRLSMSTHAAAITDGAGIDKVVAEIFNKITVRSL